MACGRCRLPGLSPAWSGLSFAAVPLYRMFCQVTGYGGTPQRADQGADKVLDRTIRIRFDANVDPACLGASTPVERVIEVKIGETALAFFKATNTSTRRSRAPPSSTSSPEQAGRYFTKIECFCFKQQTLAAGASVEMPVSFFVDPKIVEDEDTKDISEITLSYTFYRTDERTPAQPPRRRTSRDRD